jgi:hypothetical protein
MSNHQIESDLSNCSHWVRNIFESQVINSDPVTKKRTIPE